MLRKTLPRFGWKSVDHGIGVQLAVAGAKEMLTVSDAPPLVETQPSAVSALLDERAIGNCRSSAGGIPTALLAPGVRRILAG